MTALLSTRPTQHEEGFKQWRCESVCLSVAIINA